MVRTTDHGQMSYQQALTILHCAHRGRPNAMIPIYCQGNDEVYVMRITQSTKSRYYIPAKSGPRYENFLVMFWQAKVENELLICWSFEEKIDPIGHKRNSGKIT